MKKSKGFTLIELLVVVAIISLLSSVVLAALRESRNKANDSKVVSQLAGMRTSAELVNSNGSYGTAGGAGDCGSTLSGAFSNDGFGSAGNWPSINESSVIPSCYSNATANGDLITAFSLWHALNNSQGWCVDSAGNYALMSAAPESSTCGDGSEGEQAEATCTFAVDDTGGTPSYTIYSDGVPSQYYSYRTPISIPCNQSLAIVALEPAGYDISWDCADANVYNDQYTCYFNPLTSNRTLNINFTPESPPV